MPITPQQLLRVKPNKPIPRLQLGQATAPTISGEFLKTAATRLNARDKRLEQLEKEKSDFINVTFKNDLDTIRVEAESELADKKGIDALSSAVSIKDEYLKKASERLDKIPSQYRNSFDNQAAMLQGTGKFDRFTSGYTHGESRKIADEAYKSRIANEMNDMVDHAGDVEYLATTGVAQVSSSIRRDLERTYGTDYNLVLASGDTVGDVIEAEVAAGVSESITKSIQQQVNIDAYDKAHETLTDMFDNIVPDDRTKIQKIINKGLKDREDTNALGLSEEAFRLAQGDALQAEAYILARSAGNGSVAKKALNNVQAKFALRDKQKKKNEETNFAKAYDTYTKTGQMDQQTFLKLSPAGRTKLSELLNKNGGQEAKVTDQREKTRINTEWDNMTPEDIMKINVDESYSAFLSMKDRQLLKSRQEHERGLRDKGFASAQKWTPRIYEKVAKEMIPPDMMPGSEEALQFNSLVQERYAQVIKENPRATEEKIVKQLRREIRDAVLTTEDTSFFGGLFGEEQTRIELPDTLRPSKLEGIESEWIRKVQSARIRAGKREYTEDELSNFSRHLQNR